MPTVHSLTFTPAVSCDVVVTCQADLFARRSAGGGTQGSARLFRTQSAVTVNGSESLMSQDGTYPVRTRFILEGRFTVTGGTTCTVGLDATAPVPGGYAFSNIEIKVEEIRR